ncbi:MAG: hypothetical protein EOP47_24975 [Sphingobacteriaceae bacterium]|nr:MAG: hypothetical protein EOP47_24975 [Sphingobacteriaceae bacterium]
MRAIIKYLSLLLSSGLIIPFYYYYLPGSYTPLNKGVKAVVREYKPAKKQCKYNFSLIDDVAANFFPALKKLN